MTIPEAVSLILQAGATAEIGDLYVLDMGEPVKITDLARDLIRLSGLDVTRVPIVFTGLRPGERLHEALFYDHETTERTSHESIMRVRADAVGPVGKPLDALLAELEPAARRHDDVLVRELLKRVSALTAPGGAAPATAPVAVPVHEVPAAGHEASPTADA
jgi:FlaA1/EpsC-like NDP-sugar epimerase